MSRDHGAGSPGVWLPNAIFLAGPRTELAWLRLWMSGPADFDDRPFRGEPLPEGLWLGPATAHAMAAGVRLRERWADRNRMDPNRVPLVPFVALADAGLPEPLADVPFSPLVIAPLDPAAVFARGADAARFDAWGSPRGIDPKRLQIEPYDLGHVEGLVIRFDSAVDIMELLGRALLARLPDDVTGAWFGCDVVDTQAAFVVGFDADDHPHSDIWGWLHARTLLLGEDPDMELDDKLIEEVRMEMDGEVRGVVVERPEIDVDRILLGMVQRMPLAPDLQKLVRVHVKERQG